ncbi:hypothetical protein CDD80_2656 [Ophiocordyceps camponoti-rufipedis]|uniref:Nephrocystin 3-like N-terminal domain-containing protein n=1 Tax=Ophiocordyceps camponoti-rufipedis TaxID=2004952 RepID=A0A2C5XJY2_9HYPO|nr:hypothetical protein CDD80_2656 [Ophiocordyceps camponoti-rufipedis]
MATRHGLLQARTNHLVTVLEAIVQELGGAYLVLDALDECIDRDELLGIVQAIVTSSSGDFRVFLTSRQLPDIAAVLDPLVTVSLEAVAETVDRDIDLFVRHQVQSHPKLSRWQSEVQDEIRDSLVKGAGGMFRWVDCQLITLGKCLNLRNAKKAIKKLPTSLSETYRLAMARIDQDHWEYVVSTLTWLAVSPKPLEITEAVEILAVDFESKDWPAFA